MTVAVRLGGALAALVLVFVVAFGVGRAVGPIGTDQPTNGGTEVVHQPGHHGQH
ncbi:hypothetical protein [Gordonia soli]|uniref:Uncharacterized protein n=1 Tax=Gordonia soli NBRC 108243 TaxID=1223545 RepID=M0QEL5_9ACTN|nr:hypothetical protein [Gordonia soli]GAC67043.1 hypothetical protein GS4_05_02560 [Gordonia soli NBRC 108243]